MTEPFTDDDALFWDAFRYTADEMLPSEREAFERRLAEEQPAREAVARAVLLVDAVGSVQPALVVPPRSVRTRRRIAACVAAAACACAAIAFALVWNWGGAAPEGPETAADAPSIPDGGLSEALPADELVALWLHGLEDSADPAGLYAGEFSDPVDSELAVPDWMLAAASVELEPGPEGDFVPPPVQEN